MRFSALTAWRGVDNGPSNLMDVLKGAAIFMFLVYHYRIHFFGAIAAIEGYGPTAVAMFFAVSGYGLYFSLRRRLQSSQGLAPTLARYFFDRAQRLYPLYLLAMLIWVYGFGQRFAWYQWFGFDSTAWFINHILFCYAASPMLYWLATRTAPWFSLGVWVGFLLLNPLFDALPEPLKQTLSSLILYRGLVFGHLLFFYAGMRAAILRDSQPRFPIPGGLWGPLGFFAASCVACGFTQPRPLGSLLGLILALVTSQVVRTLSYRFPQGVDGFGLLALLGRYSLPLYLFESCYYFVLMRFGLIVHMSLKSAAIFVAGFPAYLASCALVTWLDARLRAGLRSVWARATPTA